MLANSSKAQLKVLFPRQFPAASTQCGHFPHFHATKDCPFPGLMVEVNLIVDYIDHILFI
jgi:hypothetical protein